MSQAEKSNSTSRLSRRTALAALAGTAAAGVSALPAGAAAPIEPDPIYAALKRHRLAWNDLNSQCSALADTAEAEAALDALHDAELEARNELSEPTTIAGAAALLYYVSDMEEKGAALGEFLDANQLAKALAKMSGTAGLSVAAVAGAVALPAAAAEVDPIFAVSADHRAAVEAWCRAISADGPDDRELSAAEDAADDRRAAAYWEVLTAQPTTLAGVAALLAHVGTPQFLDEPGPEHEDERETFLSTPNHDGGGDWKRAAQDLPVRLAETMRGLIRGRS
jgi:hypothetical protein